MVACRVGYKNELHPCVEQEAILFFQPLKKSNESIGTLFLCAYLLAWKFKNEEILYPFRKRVFCQNTHSVYLCVALSSVSCLHVL